MTDDRDRSIEILLRQSQRDADAQSPDQCVDAESLAAWMEGALTSEAHAAVERHAAECARCQALLASMARTVPSVDSRPWWRSVAVRWLVPATAIATALVVWVFVGSGLRQSKAPKPAVMEVSQAAKTDSSIAAPTPPRTVPEEPQAPPQSLQGQTQHDAAATRKEPDKSERSSRDLEASRLEAAARAKPAVKPSTVAGNATGARVDATRPASPQISADNAVRRSPTAPAAAAATPPPPAAQPVAGLLPQPAPNSPSAESKPRSPSGVAETANMFREARAQGIAADRLSAVGGVPIGGLEIPSPEPNYRWRILPNARVQRSTDGGLTWAVVDPLGSASREAAAAPAILMAGSSPARDVCWIVGRAGLVLLTTDGGAIWQRRPFAEPVDLSSVTASSSTIAVVGTADGRRFATADGGATWVLTK